VALRRFGRLLPAWPGLATLDWLDPLPLHVTSTKVGEISTRGVAKVNFFYLSHKMGDACAQD
jgi:hypothetical protein